MRASRTLLPALLLAVLLLAGTAGAQRTSTHIDDENPANADEDCFATMSYRPGYPLPMGAVRNSRKVMSIAATAPITKGLGLVVRPGGNPFNDACESPTFSSPDPGKRYFISIFTGWGSGPRC